jgi:hypothetical protein
MPRSLHVSLLVMSLGVSALPFSAIRGQDRIQTPATESPPAASREMPEPAGTDEFNARQPAVTIGGPFGVVVGGGNGVRFGGPNGAQFGGGAGARFGGRYGVQFGGGEGVRIGPSAESTNPDGTPIEAAPDNPTPMSGNQLQIVVHHPQSSRQALHVRVNGQDLEISPGETITLSGDRRVSVQIVNANGRNGPRRSLSPGNYVSRETRRGWTLTRHDAPIEPPLEEEMSHLPTALELNPPGFEQVPAPDADRETRAE